MSHPVLKGLSLLIMWLVIPIALATPHYVTDRILADLYAQPSETSRVIGQLPTGTPVELLETRGHFSQIRTADGEEGWIRLPLLISDEPAQVVLYRLVDQLDHARGTLETAERSERERGKGYLAVLAAVAVLAGIFGFVLGALWLDWRFRERHGGFRV